MMTRIITIYYFYYFFIFIINSIIYVVDRYSRELVDHVEREDDRWQHTASLIIDLETVSTQWISRGLLDIILNSNSDHNDNNNSRSNSSSNNNILMLGNNNDHIQISSSSNSSNGNSNSNSIVFNNYESIYNLREEVVYMNIIAILPVIIEWMNVQPIENGILRQLSPSIKPKVLITSPSTTTTSITFMSIYFPTFYLINNRIDGLNDVPISLHLPLHRLLSKLILYGAYGDVNLSRVFDYFHTLKIGTLCNFIGTC